MNDPTLIADLVRAGLADELVNRVATALINVRDSPGHVRDIVRAYEAGRKQKQRRNADKTSGKQTMSARSLDLEKTQNVPDISSERCRTSFLSSSTEIQRSKEEKSSRRGTRMQVGAPLPDDANLFARLEGFEPEQISKMWREFIDYWVSVPGSRGLKLDWLATWRNRVRDVKERKGAGNGTGTSPLAGVDGLIAREKARTGAGTGPLLDLTPTSSGTK